jgi:hypothetical protein
MLHATHLVFNPGGLGPVVATPEDICKHKSKTCNALIIAHNAIFTTHPLGDNPTIFSTEYFDFYLEQA